MQVQFVVTVNLDPTPGEFHSETNAEKVIQKILDDRIEHYAPRVTRLSEFVD